MTDDKFVIIKNPSRGADRSAIYNVVLKGKPWEKVNLKVDFDYDVVKKLEDRNVEYFILTEGSPTLKNDDVATRLVEYLKEYDKLLANMFNGFKKILKGEDLLSKYKNELQEMIDMKMITEIAGVVKEFEQLEKEDG
jgi:hypothetical protein